MEQELRYRGTSGKDNTQQKNDKFGRTSRFVVSSQIWLHTIPTRNCDVLVTIPTKTESATLRWLVSKLKSRVPELEVNVLHHLHTQVYGIYLTADITSLLKGAEELALTKSVKAQFGGGKKEFVYEDREFFEGIEDECNFLTSQERQNIVCHKLYNLRAHSRDCIGPIRFLEGQSIVPHLKSKGIVGQVLPLHNTDALQTLRKSWVQAFFKQQPLDAVCDYFGVKIAMYFAYLGHYTSSLLFPAAFGVFLWCLAGTKQSIDDHCSVIFAFVNVIWATLYLELWKRRSAELAYHWGTLDHEDELLVEPRPLYYGHPVRSRVTGRIEPEYSAWRRNLFRYFISFPVTSVCLGVVFVVMWSVFEFQDWVNDKVHTHNLPYFLKLIPKITLALSIGVLDDIYKKIAKWLNDKENHRLEETYQNNLIIKLILFQFVNSFLSLFYIAFYLQDMNRLHDQLATILITRQIVGNIKEALVPYVVDKLKLLKIGYHMTEDMSPGTLEKQAKEIIGHVEQKLRDIKRNVVTLSSDKAVKSSCSEDEILVEDFASNQNKGTESEYTCSLEHCLHGTLAEPPDLEISQSGPQLRQAEYEAAMKPFEDMYEDHLEMLIQFGYVTLFSSAFPLAALCALVNNVIEIRSDGFKFCMIFQRPFGQRVAGIGIWQDSLELMSVIAVMVNCALIGFSGLAYRFFPDLTTPERIVFIVLLEHIVLVAKFLLAYAIPDIPQWVAEEKARLEFLRRNALKTVEVKKRQESKVYDVPCVKQKCATCL